MRSREQIEPVPENQSEHSDSGLQEVERSHVEDLIADFRKSWAENSKEGGPDVSFKIFFSPHVKTQDVSPELRDELLNADIYMPERYDWTVDELKKWNDLSGGKIDPEIPDENLNFLSDEDPNFPRDRYHEALEIAVHDTGVEVILPDLLEGHPLIEQRDMTAEMLKKIVFLPFDEAVQKYDETTRALAMHDRAREKEIMKNIPSLIENAREKNEELRKKDSLKVVITYGAAHTSLYHALYRAGKDVTRKMSGSPEHHYQHSSELHRNYIFGIDNPKRNKELATRALLSHMVYGAIKRELRRLDVNSDELSRLSRTATDLFTIDELRDVWVAYLSTKDPSVMLSRAEEKGFTMPTTREELDQMLQSKRKP